ncbi:FAD-dependent hydroxylase [Leptolyngbya sp. FACHB-261]|uniref:FAD-dependent hydroxylase n=1 Tax=Leptolyngbya sp. FACHB-261 TaxID=2692806 RepID=UPI00168749C6|nr:FAD-dependent hydroxylase [Leptolyngbya sp. FACHB-261]MBD2104343.1 FAD-dependent hydroxylase [Leptolyngbya sp. FACHB-261]
MTSLLPVSEPSIQPQNQSQNQPQNQIEPQQARPQGYDYDLVIVGGGLVGATLACALKGSGLRIALVEAQMQSAAAARGQAYSISLLSSRIFQGLGLWQQILPQITTYRHIRLSDADHPGVVHFRPEDLGTDALGYVAEHRVLLTALQEGLQQCPTVSWLCPAEVINTCYQADGVELTLKLENEQCCLRTRLLVAADGARSQIRTGAGIGTHGWKYWQSCIVTTVKPEKPHPETAYERFWPSGPFAILPLPDSRCQIVWTAPHAEAKAMAALDDQQFLAELSRRYGSQMGQLTLAGGRVLFPVQLMHSNRYTQPRLALIGDAAHCCHPVGGQGVNMGIRDAAALAQVLQAAHQQGEDIGDWRVLKRYERWRKLENLAILGFTDLLDRCFSNQWLPLVGLRRVALWLLRTVRPLKVYALQLMTGLRGRPPELAANAGRVQQWPVAQR